MGILNVSASLRQNNWGKFLAVASCRWPIISVELRNIPKSRNYAWGPEGQNRQLFQNEYHVFNDCIFKMTRTSEWPIISKWPIPPNSTLCHFQWLVVILNLNILLSDPWERWKRLNSVNKLVAKITRSWCVMQDQSESCRIMQYHKGWFRIMHQQRIILVSLCCFWYILIVKCHWVS